MSPLLRRSACTKASRASTSSRGGATVPAAWEGGRVKHRASMAVKPPGNPLMLNETCLQLANSFARPALAAVVLGLALAGCASAPPESSTGAADYKARVVSQT